MVVSLKKIIEINNLSCYYGNKKILDNINLEIKEASFVTILGANGCGKSTMAKAMLGLIPYEGQIKIENTILKEESFSKIKKYVGMVSETYEDKFDADTPYDSIYFYLKNLGMKENEIKIKILNIQKVLKLESFMQCSISHLSISELQLLSLACVLASEPKIIILDNAMSMLDETIKNTIFRYLKKINKDKKITIINFSNNPEESIYGKDLILLHNRNILLFAPIKEALLEEKKFRQCNLELPFMASLSLKLKYYGLVDHLILDMNKMVNQLWK